MQKIFVNDYELPTSPRSSQPENIPPRNFKEEIPPRNFNSNPIRSKSLRLERRNKSSDLNREFEVANAYLQMPGLIGLQKNYKDPVQRSQSCVDTLPNHVSENRERTWASEERPDKKERSKTPEHRRDTRAKTPDRTRDRTRTPDRSRKRVSPERGDRRERSRSPEDLTGRNSGMESRPPKPDSRPRAPDTNSLDGRNIESIYLDPRPLKPGDHHPLDGLENNYDPQVGDELGDELGEMPDTETSHGEKGSDTKRVPGEGPPGCKPRTSDTRGRQGSRRHKEAGDELYQNSEPRYAEERPVRHRAYSDSEAENYIVDPPSYRFVEFNHPSARIKHSKIEKSRKPGPPYHGARPERMPERYYKIPYRIPYYARPTENPADLNYENTKSSKPERNGTLLAPAHRSSKNSRNNYRPYPAPYAPRPPYCTYQSETTENDYYTPNEPVVPSGKKSKHKRSHSDSSSSCTLTTPWAKDCNKILTPKYPLPSLRDGTPLGSNDRSVRNSSKYLHKLKCTPSANNVWHDPLLGQDKTDIVYSGDNDSEKSKDESPMESFADFTGDVALNYLRFIWNSPEVIRKIIWGSLFIGFFVYSFLCCWRSFAIWIDKPTATKYNMYFEPNKILTFPSITICNMNPHNKDYLEIEKNLPMKAYLYRKSEVDLLDNMDPPNEAQSKNFNVKNYYRNSGQKLPDFIENVKFKEEPLDVSLAFKEKFTTHGLCWVFNADGLRNVNRTGMDFGLSLGININQDIYPKFVTKAGVKIMFHNKYEPALIDEYGMALTPGTENFISLSYTRNRDLKTPTGGCRDEPLKQGRQYSVSGCERQCFTEIMIEMCGCKSYYLLGTEKECRLYDEAECVKDVVERYHNGEFLDRPNCQCADPCLSANYLATLSTAEYPAKNFGEALQEFYKTKTDGEGKNVQYFRENLLKVHIYFEILSIKEVEKVRSYKWSNLMGDVGGQLGLFLGANVVTIFEFVDYYARLFWYNCVMKIFLHYVKNKKTNQNHNP